MTSPSPPDPLSRPLPPNRERGRPHPPRRRPAILIAFLLTSLVLPGAADPQSSGDNRDPGPYGFGQLRDDAEYLAKKPCHLDRKGRRKALAIAGTTLALYSLRDEIRDAIRDHPSDSLSRLASDARDVFGKGAFAPALALVAYGASFATGNPREKETAFLLLESMAFSVVATRTGSFTLAAERPADGDSFRLFDPAGRGVSLDVALAASVIQPLRRQYFRIRPGDGGPRRFWKRFAAGVLWAGAALTAYQRMDADQHWAPDVFLGLVTGLEVGRALGESHDGAAAGAATLRLGLVPRGVGFRVQLEPGRR